MAEPVRARRLTDQEGRRLLQIVRRGKHWSVRVRRAMIIMASASGTLAPAIARYLAGLGRPVRIGRERLRQLLHERGISFQRTRTWKESTSSGRCRSGPATACAGRRANGRPGCARLITAPTASATSMAATAWAMTSCGASLASIRAPITPWPP